MKPKQKVNLRTWRTKSGKKRLICLYNVWTNMLKRCKYENHQSYHRYGGRGIVVCGAWMDFIVFREWALKSGYRKGLTIDRKNNDGNYEPDNCRWATWKEQANNKFHNPNNSGRFRPGENFHIISRRLA